MASACCLQSLKMNDVSLTNLDTFGRSVRSSNRSTKTTTNVNYLTGLQTLCVLGTAHAAALHVTCLDEIGLFQEGSHGSLAVVSQMYSLVLDVRGSAGCCKPGKQGRCSESDTVPLSHDSI